MSKPISIGFISSLVRIAARAELISSPCLATMQSSLIAIFPASTAVLILNALSSPIIGPGIKGVVPALTTISLGAICPAFAGAGDFDSLTILYILKGFSFVNKRAGIPLRNSVNFEIPFLFCSTSSKAIFINLLFVIIISAIPLNLVLIC